MAKRRVVLQDRIVVGTASDKYESRNPIARYLVRRFDVAVLALADRVAPANIVEVGCGEGHVTGLLLGSTEARVLAYDISEQILGEAWRNIGSPRVRFARKSIYDVAPETEHAELVVCCEVLEHPEAGLARLAAIASPYCLLSVPRGPLWRAMNMARSAYLRDFGNSPGHLQHWSRRAFPHFVRTRFDIVETRLPLPWTFVLAISRDARGV